MQPEDRDTGYLWDMIEAARAIRDFTVDVALDEHLQIDSLLPPAPQNQSA